jgi:hypothetical protein
MIWVILIVQVIGILSDRYSAAIGAQNLAKVATALSQQISRVERRQQAKS